MRILFVNRMAAMVRGGGETFDLEMARQLGELGCHTEMLTGLPLSGGQPRVQLNHPGVHLLRSPYSGDLPWDKFRLGWRFRIMDFRIFEIMAARWICQRQDQYDIVQICEMPPLITELQKRHCRIPQVIRITAPDYHDADSAVKKASAVIASGTSMQFLRENVRPDCFNIPNGVDLQRFRPGQPSDVRAKHGIPDDAIVCIHVARFQAVKNHEMLLAAFAELRAGLDAPAHLILAGGGPLEGQVRSQIQRLKLGACVHVLGEVSFSEVPDLYAASDINLVSSDYESFSFTALEGMAAGLPLVTTRTEWVPTLINETEGGITVPIGDASAFADAMKTLAENPEARAAKGAWNRQRVEQDFGWPSSARKLLNVYQELAG